MPFSTFSIQCNDINQALTNVVYLSEMKMRKLNVQCVSMLFLFCTFLFMI